MADQKTKPAPSEYRLIRKIDATPETLILEFEPLNAMVSFKPGGSVMIRGIDDAGKKYAARAFSVASAPSSRLLKLLAIKTPKHGDQVHTSHFVEAKEGDKFELTAPPVKFYLDPTKSNNFVFIAGGTGLAPFLAMLDEIRLMEKKIDAVLVYSVRYPNEILEREHLEQLEMEGVAKIIITVTRPTPGDGWRGNTGHIDEKILAQVPNLNERNAMICGNYNFAMGIKEILRKHGVPEDRIDVDAWG